MAALRVVIFGLGWRITWALLKQERNEFWDVFEGVDRQGGSIHDVAGMQLPAARANASASGRERVAVVTVWMVPPETPALSQDELANTYCASILAVSTGARALTNLAESNGARVAVDRVIIVNASTAGDAALKFLSDNGIVWHDVGDSPFVTQYQQTVATGGKAVHAAKLEALGLTEYSFVMLMDSDLYFGENITSPIMASRNGLAFHHGVLSPLNAGLFGARPDSQFLDDALRALKHGYRIDGWGGNYNKAAAQTHILPFVQRWLDTECIKWATHECCQAAQKGNQFVANEHALFCFIGRDQDQGLLVHLAFDDDHPRERIGDDTNALTKSLITPLGAALPEYSFSAYSHHAYKPKPTAVLEWLASMQAASGEQLHLQDRFFKFWDVDIQGYMSSLQFNGSRKCEAHFEHQIDVVKHFKASSRINMKSYAESDGVVTG